MVPAGAIDKMKTAAILLPGDGQRLNVIGDAQTIKVDGAMSNGLFAMIEQNNRAGAGVPLHVHTREDETFYVAEGELTFQVGEIEVFAPAGTTVHLPRGVPHGFRANKPTRGLVCLHPAGVENMFRKLGELTPGPPDMEKVSEICAHYGIYFL
jgi:mannose-6-phosphate isomerase-like protein (cupin superfamily)